MPFTYLYIKSLFIIKRLKQCSKHLKQTTSVLSPIHIHKYGAIGSCYDVTCIDCGDVQYSIHPL